MFKIAAFSGFHPPLMEDSGEQFVLAISFACSSFIGCASECGIKFTAFQRGRVNEPADSIGIVIDADSSAFRYAITVVACDGGFG